MQNQEQTTQDTTLPQQGRLEIWRQGFKRAFLQFLVLMWMHLTLRKRKFIVTPIELISPCFFFIIILAIKPLIYENLGVEEPPGTTVLRMHEVPLDNIMAPQLILYTPDTPLTRRLMDEAGRKMYMTRILDFPVASSRGYYGLNEDSIKYNIRLSNLLRSMSDFSAVVIFEDMEDEYWPERLNYLIRIKNDFDGKEAGEDKTSQHSRGMSELFMRLQWAIDTSYMTLFVYDKSNRNIAADVPKLSLSEIPLSDALTEVIVHIVCTALRITCPIALMLPFVFLLSKLIDERSTGAQELLKQVGVSFSTWANAHGCNMILTGLFYSIFGTVACKVPDPYIPKSNAILLFLLFELHFHSILTFAFICCYMTKSGDYATTLSVALFIVSTVPARMLDGRELPQIVLYLTGLLPHVPFIWFWREVESLETNGTGVNFISFTKSHTTTSMSVLMGYAMMVLQILIFFRIAIYFDAICPGKYGTKKPWNYMWKRKENVALTAMAEVAAEDTTRDPRFFEESRQLTNIGINIDQVSKIFGKKIALSNVSLHVYHGEITVLLGHNGAGKTTLMSIITGMLSPTSGNVYVKGLDICQDQAKVQTMVGVCPQHNLFFPDLTVMEHVRLFAMLKGQSYEKANESSKILLQKLNIESKKNNKASELSGGMKRRLQLACALSGDSSVLVLDEPTSGLDVETRRELWDLLLSLRGDRTVVLSTHFMEEADALGDRVAALHAGRLQCHATPMFLKKNIGSGYRLFLTTEGRPQEHDITKLVTSVVSAATVKESGYNSISYNLPSESSKKFPQLFSKLESKKAQLSIISIGVGVSSLEDVFLQLVSLVT